MLETVTKQYREENRDKCIEKGQQHYEKCNERLQKMAVINTDDYLKKKR